ncbi:IS5 family transposase [Bacteroides sp. UBA939]|uniref:IS5 family transposase n=1 Tax=Bacteroides sp. UBA939 TaxID=1946092 RepID=UPI0025C6BE3C|nr:IS5 family transposase [Bacteroides sp. UBA939]
MYRTDLTEIRWQYIKKVLHIQIRKRKHDLREIWNALFYVVKTGCQWRMLPSHFPKWQLVYYYYRKWSSQTDFDLLLNELRGLVRLKRGQYKDSTVGIMDSQSVRWGNNRSLNGIDGNKKVKGIKRHVIVDKNGFLIAVMVTVANVHDSKAAYLLVQMLKKLCSSVKVILADGGYRGNVIEAVKKSFGYIIQVVVSNYKELGFRPIHKRWIVERTFSWFDNYRRLCRNYELTFDSAEEMVKIASIRLLLNKI